MPPKKPTGAAAGGGEKTKSKLQQMMDDDQLDVHLAAIQQNLAQLNHCRIFSGIVAGCLAGLLRFEGLSGIAVYIMVTVMHSAMIFAKTTFNVTRYFPRKGDVFLQKFTAGLMPFILFWTLAYDTVHIF
mmetsp:Transcript_16751/g.27104  ORF Transcript_16751/g.27104 Transcript_16751/m.27104 type:complete len:129 (+) Transcript_16751:77-463(+)